MIVVGKIPDPIEVPARDYIELLRLVEALKQGASPQPIAQQLVELVAGWTRERVYDFAGDRQVEELPLEWDHRVSDGAKRAGE